MLPRHQSTAWPAPVTTVGTGAVDPLLLEGILHVLAGVLRPLADLPRGPAEPLSLPLHFKVWVAARAAGLCLGPALTHAEPVPQFVNQAHAARLLGSGYQPGSSTPGWRNMPPGPRSALGRRARSGRARRLRSGHRAGPPGCEARHRGGATVTRKRGLARTRTTWVQED